MAGVHLEKARLLTWAESKLSYHSRFLQPTNSLCSFLTKNLRHLPHSHNDHSCALLLMWQGRQALLLGGRRQTLTAAQVTGDLWERYLVLIDQNTQDG